LRGRGFFVSVGFPGENFKERDLTQFPYEILFICLTYSFPTQFCMWSNSREIFNMFGFPVDNFLEWGFPE